jgi:hypothetical protein
LSVMSCIPLKIKVNSYFGMFYYLVSTICPHRGT